MVRRSGGGYRGIERGVRRHQIQLSGSKRTEIQRFFVSSLKKFILCVAYFVFEFTPRICTLVYLTPYKIDSDGRFLMRSYLGIALNVIVSSVTLLRMVHMGLVSINRLIFYPFSVETIMCSTTFLIFLGAWGTSYVVVFKPQETVDLLNCSKALAAGKKNFLSFPIALKIAAVAESWAFIALAGPLLSIAFPNLPVGMYVAAKQIGVLPFHMLPTVAWRVIFFNVEVVLYMALSLSVCLSAQVFLVSLSIQQQSAVKLRKILEESDGTYADDVEAVQQYTSMEVLNKIQNQLSRPLLPTTIAGLSAINLMFLYITVRHTELPILLYSIFPGSAVVVIGVAFAIADDVANVKRLSESVISFFAEPSKATGISCKYLKKRAKAMRPVTIWVGDFGEYTLGVPVNALEEVLNQLLLLLSF